VCIVFVRQLERNEISCQITGNGISEGLKSQNFLGEHAPRPPQRGTAFACSKYSPVTLYYSPATTILNENPALYLLVWRKMPFTLGMKG